MLFQRFHITPRPKVLHKPENSLQMMLSENTNGDSNNATALKKDETPDTSERQGENAAERARRIMEEREQMEEDRNKAEQERLVNEKEATEERVSRRENDEDNDFRSEHLRKWEEGLAELSEMAKHNAEDLHAFH